MGCSVSRAVGARFVTDRSNYRPQNRESIRAGLTQASSRALVLTCRLCSHTLAGHGGARKSAAHDPGTDYPRFLGFGLSCRLWCAWLARAAMLGTASARVRTVRSPSQGHSCALFRSLSGVRIDRLWPHLARALGSIACKIHACSLSLVGFGAHASAAGSSPTGPQIFVGRWVLGCSGGP